MFNSNPVIAVYKKLAEDSFKQIHSKILHVFILLGTPTVAEVGCYPYVPLEIANRKFHADNLNSLY